MVWIRYALYFFLVVAVLGVLTRLEVNYPGFLNIQVFLNPTDSLGTSEYSPIELMQPVMLLACCALMLWVALYCPAQRTIAVGLGGLSLAFMVRELDFFFNRLIVENLWQVIIGIAGALVIVYLYRHNKRLRIAVARTWPSPGFVLLFAGGCVLAGAVHLVGHEPLWQSIAGDAYQRAIKLAVEEFVELLGYLFWLIGTIEYAYEAKALAFNPRVPARRRREGRRRK
ncbi:MAG: hypothetical protein QNJ19_10420 [Woeseiaceae bacterium]|nr:hypothetical protein [Woeseiaceae bacterium]